MNHAIARKRFGVAPRALRALFVTRIESSLIPPRAGRFSDQCVRSGGKFAIDPSSDYAWHVLGAWNYELAGLNPVLRAIAKVVYGGIPAASYEDAVTDFKKAVKIAPQRVSHHVELGRAYAALGQTELARTSLQKGLSLPSREKDDADTKERARVALKAL